jgi:hypothetical protein
VGLIAKAAPVRLADEAGRDADDMEDAEADEADAGDAEGEREVEEELL